MVIAWCWLPQGEEPKEGPDGGFIQMANCVNQCKKNKGPADVVVTGLLPSQRQPSSRTLLALEEAGIPARLLFLGVFPLCYTLFWKIPLSEEGLSVMAVLINYCNSYEKELLSGGAPRASKKSATPYPPSSASVH